MVASCRRRRRCGDPHNSRAVEGLEGSVGAARSPALRSPCSFERGEERRQVTGRLPLDAQAGLETVMPGISRRGARGGHRAPHRFEGGCSHRTPRAVVFVARCACTATVERFIRLRRDHRAPRVGYASHRFSTSSPALAPHARIWRCGSFGCQRAFPQVMPLRFLPARKRSCTSSRLRRRAAMRFTSPNARRDREAAGSTFPGVRLAP